jgi:hypothetical protein
MDRETREPIVHEACRSLSYSLVFHHTDTHVSVFYLALALSLNNKHNIERKVQKKIFRFHCIGLNKCFLLSIQHTKKTRRKGKQVEYNDHRSNSLNELGIDYSVHILIIRTEFKSLDNKFRTNSGFGFFF